MYGWRYPREKICFSLGIIPALYKLTDLLLSDEDKAIMNTPARYRPFFKTSYRCNPHNPTGRVWTEEEPRRVAAHSRKI